MGTLLEILAQNAEYKDMVLLTSCLLGTQSLGASRSVHHDAWETMSDTGDQTQIK